MKIRIIFVIITALLIYAQEYITWENDYPLPYGDGIFSVEQTSDGGYIAGGWYYYQLSIDWYNIHARIIKIDAYGNMEWERAFMLSDVLGNGIYSVIENSDGDFIAAGETEYSGRSRAIMVLKYDKNGNYVWSKFYGSLGRDTRGSVIKETAGKGYIIAGREQINDSVTVASLIKLDSNGDSLWTVTNETGLNSEYTNFLTDNNELIAVGRSQTADYQSNALLVKIDSSGNELWNKLYENMSLTDICKTDSFYMCSGGIIGKRLIAKLNQLGDTISVKYFDTDIITSMISFRIADGNNFICAGQVDTPDDHGTNKDWCIIKFDQNLDTLWRRVYGNPSWVSDDYLWGGCKPTADGGYIAGGDIFYCTHVMKLDENGTVGIIEHDFAGNIEDYSIEQNYPNPFNCVTTIEYNLKKNCEVDISIYNSNGQFVKNLVNRKQNRGNYGITFDGSMLNSGIYYYQLKINGIIKDSRRMLYLK